MRGGGPALPRVLFKGFVLIATLLALGWLVEASGLSIDEAWVDSEVRGRGLRGEALFIAMAAATVAVGVPRQLAAFLGGYAFGIVEGTALALLAMVLGCIADFVYARLIGRDFVQARFGARIGRFDSFLRDNPFATTLLIRLLPAGNNLLTNLVAGVSTVRPLPFFAGSAIGYVPQAMIFALLGSGVKVDPLLRISASAALFVASGLLGVHLFRRIRRNRRAEEDLAAIMEPDGEDAAATGSAPCATPPRP
jgi:uncharacterized membrane protein YdjX (TVP38/TMEM64 family)